MNISELKSVAIEQGLKSVDFSFKNEKNPTFHATMDLEKDKITIFGLNETHNSSSFDRVHGKSVITIKLKEEVAEKPSAPSETTDPAATIHAENEIRNDEEATPVALEGQADPII